MKTTLVFIAAALLLLATAFAQQCTPTGADIEGPYYVAGAPNRTNAVCEHSPAEDRLIMRGQVLSRDCKPLPFTKLDLWQANPKGQYSEGSKHGSSDFSCRGVVYSDANGFYEFTTLMPGRYDDDGYRPAHIHLKATPADRAYGTFNTQIYFSNDQYLYPNDSCDTCNSKDATLVANVVHHADIKTFESKWNIVLQTKQQIQEAEVAEEKEAIRLRKAGVAYTTKKDHIISRYKEEMQEMKEEIDTLVQKVQYWKEEAEKLKKMLSK